MQLLAKVVKYSSFYKGFETVIQTALFKKLFQDMKKINSHPFSIFHKFLGFLLDKNLNSLHNVQV